MPKEQQPTPQTTESSLPPPVPQSPAELRAVQAAKDLYAQAIAEAERPDYDNAIVVEGLDAEIALLRLKIKSVLEKRPGDVRLLMEASETLAKLVKTKHAMDAEQKAGLKEALTNVLKEVAIHLGIQVIEKWQ